MITFYTSNTQFQQKWVQKLSDGAKVCMTMAMLCFFFFTTITTATAQPQTSCPYNITLVTGYPSFDGTNTTFVWSVTNPTNSNAQDLSWWGFVPNTNCPTGMGLDESDIVRAGWGASVNAAIASSNTNALSVDIKADKSQECTGNTAILKFDHGTTGNTPTYYSLVLEGNWNTATMNAWYKSGSRTGPSRRVGSPSTSCDGWGCGRPS